MERRPSLRPSPALVIAMLALFVAIGGGAYAASKVGKNKVVTKSIKNGAVTGPKIKAGAVGGEQLADGAITGAKVADGSIGAADLAPGTVPAPAGSVQFAATADASTAVNGVTTRNPVGVSEQTDPVSMIAPVDLEISKLRADGSPMGIGQARFVSIDISPFEADPNLATLGCTIQSGQSACTNNGSATIPAGSSFLMGVVNGPGGAPGGLVRVGYVLTPK